MHYIRGLARKSSFPSLKQLEKLAEEKNGALFKECFSRTPLIDAEGNVETVVLLQTVPLLRLMESRPPCERLSILSEAKKKCLEDPDASVGSVAYTESSKKDFLYMKGSTSEVKHELKRRQLGFLYRLEGKCCAGEPETVLAIRETIERLLKNEESDAAFSFFKGAIQELSISDPKLALSFVLDKTIQIPLCGVTGELAKIVNVEKEDAYSTFFRTFSPMDSTLAASQTGATALALRLQKEILSEEKVNGSSERCSESSLIRFCQEYNVDPGSVYPADSRSIQQWSSVFFLPSCLPMERREAILKVVEERHLLPRRICLNALSAWCGSDLERDWVQLSIQSSSKLGKTHSHLADRSVEIAEKTSMALLLKDPQRNFVEQRLLPTYRDLLATGELSPHHSSFASFIDECGDCHEKTELPSPLVFTMKASVSPSETLQRSLMNLAPRSSYWLALLTCMPTSFTLTVAPFHELRVEVSLPLQHECVAAAEEQVSSGILPSLPLLYEDEDLMVLNKPPNIATTRHALSCSQSGDRSITDVVSVLLTQFRECLSSLPRNGLVHRLDSETSGCLVVAKSLAAVSSLRHQMGTAGAFGLRPKTYVALCVVLENDLRTIPLHGTLKDPSDAKIITTYKIDRLFPKNRVAVVECHLQQGKKHQIRRHLAAAGMPILGDVVHGGSSCVQNFISRTALHARSIMLMHPRSADCVSFTAPLPADFRVALQLLEDSEHHTT